MTKEEITSILAELHNITGFRVSLHGPDYAEIAAYPAQKSSICRMIHARPQEYARCVESDRCACRAAIEKRGTHIYKCRFGMTEAISPLYNFGTLTGFLIMGQVCEGEESLEFMKAKLEALGISGDGAAEALSAVRTVDANMVPSFVKVMTICAQYLTISHAIPNNKPSVAWLAREYISRHFNTKLPIKKICSEIGCSKSALVTAFKREYGTTVNAYINDVRLEEARHLIEQGEYKIGEISEACGFSDQSYFSKVFSAKYGIPPSDWPALGEKPREFWR